MPLRLGRQEVQEDGQHVGTRKDHKRVWQEPNNRAADAKKLQARRRNGDANALSEESDDDQQNGPHSKNDDGNVLNETVGHSENSGYT